MSSVSQKYRVVIILSEVSQTKTDITWCHLCAESKKKMIQMNFLQNSSKPTDIEKKLATKGERGRGKLGVWT